jgi:hypothetical protein
VLCFYYTALTLLTCSLPHILLISRRLAKIAGIKNSEQLSKKALLQHLEDIPRASLERMQRRMVRSGVLDVATSTSSSSSSSSSGKKRQPNELNLSYMEGACTSSCSSGFKGTGEDIPKDSTMQAKKRRKQPLNRIDPIMFVPLKKKGHVWSFVRPGGSRVAFNVETLVDFMLTSGDFHDPETRIPFSDADLEEIDRVAAASGAKKASVLAARRNPQVYVDAKFRRDALEGLERCAGDVVTEMLNLIERADPDEAQMRLVMVDLPLFTDYYHQLRDADSAYAKHCMEHWMQFIIGPPNKPHPDPHGLIAFLSHFLRGAQNLGGASMGYGGILNMANAFGGGHHFGHDDENGDY